MDALKLKYLSKFNDVADAEHIMELINEALYKLNTYLPKKPNVQFDLIGSDINIGIIQDIFQKSFYSTYPNATVGMDIKVNTINTVHGTLNISNHYPYNDKLIIFHKEVSCQYDAVVEIDVQQLYRHYLLTSIEKRYL